MIKSENLSLPVPIKTSGSYESNINDVKICFLNFIRNFNNENFKTIVNRGLLQNLVYTSDVIELKKNIYNEQYTNSSDTYNIDAENGIITMKQNGTYEHSIKVQYKLSTDFALDYINIRDLRLCLMCENPGVYDNINGLSINKTKSLEFSTISDVLYTTVNENHQFKINFFILQNNVDVTDTLLTIFNIKWVIKKID